MDKKILDVSRWQGKIDWEKVKTSGQIDGVMLRVLGSKQGKPYVDPQFERNYATCARLGIPVGGYYYSTAVTRTMADTELQLLRETLRGKTLQLPVAADIEDEVFDLLSKADLTDLVAYELEEIESWGVYAMLYTYLNFAENHLYLGGAALKPYDVWLAAYRKARPKTTYEYGMWQYTSKGQLPGIPVSVDLSRAYKDYPAIIQKAGLGQVKGS